MTATASPGLARRQPVRHYVRMPRFDDKLAERWNEWSPPSGWTRIHTIDAHAEGEPLRVVFGGFPTRERGSVLERRAHAKEQLDALRTALMWEPRGHADMYGCILMPPVEPDADFAVLFTHNEGYSTMCGHGIIAVTTVVLETGLFPATAPETTLRIDTPAGRVVASAHVEDGRVAHVSFLNVPSFVLELDASVEVAGIGPIDYDLAFGGAFYAYVDADALGLALEPSNVGRLIDVGSAIKRTIAANRVIRHPDNPDLGFLYGTIFTGASAHADRGMASTTGAPEAQSMRGPIHSRHVCVFAEGEVDRSPTGTGVSGRAAILDARGALGLDDRILIDSIIGSTFSVRIRERVRIGELDAVVPEVDGRARITGRHEFLIDPGDPFARGFLVR